MPLFYCATSRGRRSLHVAAAERTPSQVPCGGGRGAARDAPSCSEASRSPGHRARLGASRSGLSPLVVLGPPESFVPWAFLLRGSGRDPCTRELPHARHGHAGQGLPRGQRAAEPGTSHRGRDADRAAECCPGLQSWLVWK